MATSAPSSASRDAIAWPRPRPDPVTSATSPFNENSLSISPLLHPSECFQVLNTFAQLLHLVLDNRRRRLLLFPRCPIVRIIIQTLRLESLERGTKLRGGARGIPLPPLRCENADVPDISAPTSIEAVSGASIT